MVLDTLTAITLMLFVSFVFSEIFFRIKYPRVIGQLLAGIILGIPIFKILMTPDILSDISFLADLGIVFLLLLTGMKLNLEKFRSSGRDSIMIALFSVFFPFILGFILMKALDYSNMTAFVVGAAFSLTAEGTKLNVLMDIKALNSKVGVIMLGAGILDDVFEVIFLSIVLLVAQHTFFNIAILPLKIFLFAGLVYLAFKIFPKILRTIHKENSKIATFSLMLLFALVVATLSNNLELGPIIGAFIAGLIINTSNKRKKERKESIKELELMTFAFIIPFFFINIGLNFDYSIFSHNMWLTLMVTLLATFGKLLGALVATPFTKLNLRQTHLIGWGMNSRGAIELVIAEVARINNLIPVEVYSAVVFMAVVSTLIFPFVIKSIVSADRSILNE